MIDGVGRIHYPTGPTATSMSGDSAIAHQMRQSKGHTKASLPNAIYRFKPGTEGVAGY